ncbi:hypothetical protein V5H98_07380 [Georgenia sp. M64]|uniref:hypothetical protein n=1 Tax=Georgenia sp. M64 TaxID=3120520 RepID=UPI0030E112C2
MTWHLRELAHEAWANQGPRQLILALIALGTLAGIAILTGLQAIRAIDQESARREGGSLVWMAIADEDAALDSVVCDDLNDGRGVAAAGGVFAAMPPTLTAFSGGPPVPTAYVTPRATTVWTPHDLSGQVVLGRDLAKTRSVGVGSALRTADGASTVIVDAQTTGAVAHAGARSRVLIPRAPGGLLTECWVRMEPGAINSGENLLRFAFAGEHADIVPFTPAISGVLSPSQQWRAFAATYPWVAGGVVLGLVGVLLAWSRRSELAVYRTFGTTRAEVALMLWIEAAIAMVPAAFLAATAAMLYLSAIEGGPVLREVLVVLARTIGAAAAIALALIPPGAVVAMRGRLVDQLKDR